MKHIIRNGHLFASEAEANVASPAKRQKRKASLALFSIGGVTVCEIHAEASSKSRKLRKLAKKKLKERSTNYGRQH